MKHYYSGTNAIIFVVDSSDVARYEIAYQELSKLLDNYELRELPLLIFANKQVALHLLPTDMTSKYLVANTCSSIGPLFSE